MKTKSMKNKELIELLKEEKKGTNNKTVMDVGEAAEFLKTTKSAIYQMVQRGQIPFHRQLVRRIRFFKEELIVWLEKQSFYPEGFKDDNKNP